MRLLNKYNKFAFFIHNFYFKVFKINDQQSFSYQIMIILMHIHKMKRLGIHPEEYVYLGMDEIIFSEKEWKNVCGFIKKNISFNYRQILKEISKKSGEENEYFFITSLIATSNILEEEEKEEEESEEKIEISSDIEGIGKNSKYYTFLVSENIHEEKEYKFIMTSSGYSYQYNGYKKSDVRLQDKANLFAMIAILGASFGWLTDKEFINYHNLKEFFFYIFISCMVLFIYSLRKKKLYITLGLSLFTVVSVIVFILFFKSEQNQIKENTSITKNYYNIIIK